MQNVIFAKKFFFLENFDYRATLTNRVSLRVSFNVLK